MKPFLVCFNPLNIFVNFLKGRAVLAYVLHVLIDPGRVVLVDLFLVSSVLVYIFSNICKLIVCILSQLLVIIA